MAAPARAADGTGKPDRGRGEIHARCIASAREASVCVYEGAERKGARVVEQGLPEVEGGRCGEDVGRDYDGGGVKEAEEVKEVKEIWDEAEIRAASR
jgi:hypothetical protein